jgi:hypothetical protein
MNGSVETFVSVLGYRFPEPERTWTLEKKDPAALEAAPHARFRRAIERRALWMAEDAARELPSLPLADAPQLVHLYAERGLPRYEKAARRWARAVPGTELAEASALR